MRIGIYLTCQGKYFDAIRPFLPDHVQFFYEENWVMFAARTKPTPEWQDLDYFVYQPIVDPVSDEYSDENILARYVAPRATRIRVPFVMFTGLTPWRVHNDDERLGTSHGNNWIDPLSDDELEQPGKLREVLERDDDEIWTVAEKSLAHMRDKDGDLSGLTDWIDERFRDMPLFWTPNHLRGVLAREFCNRILRLMALPELPPVAIEQLDRVLDVERTPVFPGVARRLGIRRPHNIAFRAYGKPVSIPEYVAAYARSALEIRHSAGKATNGS